MNCLMKKIISIILAGAAALAAVSCAKQELVRFDDSKATAPVVNAYNITDDGIFVEFTAGSFNQNFNQKMPANHSLVILTVNGKPMNKVLSSSINGNVISVSKAALCRTLIAQGFEEGAVVSLEMALRLSMQDAARDNTRNGYMEAVSHITVPSFEVVVPQGSPYEEYTEISTWSVIGALSGYGISWDGDLNMWTDGKGNHVAAHVTLSADDEFKFRKDQDWGVNFGGTYGSPDEEFALTQDGPNIKVGTAGVYDIFFNESGHAWISAAFDPYPEYTETSTWSVIGALAHYDISWNGDIAMVSDGTNHLALSVVITAEDEFKFRKDADWAENLGGEFGGIDAEFPVTQDGANIKIGAEGVFDIFVNPAAGTATISNASGAKVSTVIGGDEPEPGPEPVTGWNIIGLNGDWDNDIRATQDGKLWTAYITAEGDTNFKWRKDGGWDENYGGVMAALGQPFEAVPGGDNITVESGSYIVTYDPTAATITVSEIGWGLVGTINGWGGTPDIILKEDGLFLVARNVALTDSDEIKIRYKQSWDENRGASTVIGVPVKAVPGGANIKPGVAGNYDVYYRPDCEVIIVNPAGADLNYWGVVGTINSWGAPDVILWQNDAGQLQSDEIELSATDEIKIRMNETWTVDRGGTFAELGQPIDVTQGGPNIKVGRAATVSVVYNAAAETVTLNGAYSGDAPSLPENMYMIGDAVGGWDWEANGTEMIPVNGKAGQFWAIRNIEAGKGFKFNSVKAWGGDFTGLGEDTGYTVSDGNCYVADSGIYMIYVDTENKKLCVEPAKVYGMGACFGGWNEAMDTALFTASEGKLSVTVAASGELRMYAASSIATSDWWTREFIILEGRIAYRGNGGDQERVNVSAGQKVTLDFNAGTGSIN